MSTRVDAVMTRTVATVLATDSLAHAVKRMRRLSCGSCVVMDEGLRPIAVVTDRDICLHAEWTNRPLSDLAVQAAMSKRVFVCRASDTARAALEQMELHQVRRLPVVGDDGRLCGVVALDDLARLAREQQGWIGAAVASSEIGRALGAVVRPHWTDEIYE